MALAVLLLELREGNPDAKALMVALAAIAAGEGAEFLRLSGAPLPTFMPYAGFTVAIFSVAAMLAGRFARHMEDLDALRWTLEQRVTERTAALRDMMQRAQAANEAKSRFLTNMSHELRTPLNAVIGFSTVLIKRLGVTNGMLSRKELGFLERIRSNGVHLLALVDGVLDLSVIEAGAVRLETRSVDLAPLLQGILEDMSPRAEVKGVRLATVVPGRTLPIETDPVRLRQILVNLVDNAIKFTERGGVTVTVVTAGARPLRIEVRDTGVGIPADRLAVVFEAFSQVDDTTARAHYGMGLGLAITRALCDLLRYRLTLESEPGVGTVVTVDLDRGVWSVSGVGAVALDSALQR
jgi:signal transduction histidine kinase